MDYPNEEWQRKGATLSDKTARAEFGLTQDEIYDAIDAGTLHYREASMHGYPWLRLESLAREISRGHSTDKMLAVRDEEGLTPAGAVAAGGAARDRVLALLDDCEWQRRRKRESGERNDLLPAPAELRRRLGIR